MAYDNTELATIDRFNHEVEVINNLIRSKALPENITNATQGVAIAKYGRELGMDVMTSLTHISLVRGKPHLSIDYVIGKFVESGGSYRILEMSSEISKVKVRDRWGSWFEFSFTIKDAEKDGSLRNKKDKWGNENNKYLTIPDRMLFVRNMRNAIRLIAPEVFLGITAHSEPEEDITEMGLTNKRNTEKIGNFHGKGVPEYIEEAQKEDNKNMIEENREDERDFLVGDNAVLNVKLGIIPPSDEELKKSTATNWDYKEAIKETESKDLTEGERIVALSEDDFRSEIEKLTEEAKTDDDIENIYKKYGNIRKIPADLRLTITEKRAFINSDKK